MSKKQTYAEALAEIEEIIKNIENNEYSIDELADKVKKISTLISFCKEKLRGTDEELSKIIKKMEE